MSTETQPERTVLSWQRTALGLLTVAALLGHSAVREGRVLPAVAAAAVALAGLGVLAGVAPRRARQLARRPAAAPGAVAVAAAAVALAGLGVLAGVAPRRARQLARRPAAAPGAVAVAVAAVAGTAVAAAAALLSR